MAGRPAADTPPAGSPIPPDPYAALTPEQYNAMKQELAEAEDRYAPRFAEAERIQDENERRAKIDGLRNSFGTKQSMIRKKYGVRLRERRTKAEIQAERERLGLKRAERERARASLPAQQQDSSPAIKTETPGAAARPAPASAGWVAANTPRASSVWEEHDAKRRRTDATGGYQTPYKSLTEDTPTHKTLSVSEIGGGLTASAATAETVDPTRPPQSHQESPGAKSETAAENTPSHDGDGDHEMGGMAASGPFGNGTGGAADTDGKDDDDDESDSSDDDEDIPSTLPDHVRQSLTPQQKAG